MINATITGTLPQIQTDLTPAMKRIADILEASQIKGFNTSGYGRWPATREGKPATLSGLRKTLQKSSGDNWAEVSAMNTIHQRGGVMNQTPRMRSFFWAKWYETKEERFKWMALSKRAMTFPTRTYLTLQEVDFESIRKELIDRIFSVKETIGEKA
jgi:phage gpG-like protein